MGKSVTPMSVALQTNVHLEKKEFSCLYPLKRAELSKGLSFIDSSY
jgi:hypothetical protein